MIIAVASGKGGTGKTTISTNLALSLTDQVQLLDCDVEEPNAHLFIKPEILEKHTVTIPVPQIDRAICTLCGKCAKICAYNAIAIIAKQAMVFPELCHSCGACKYFCPAGAIKEVNHEVGFTELGSKNNIQFIHGQLNVGKAIAIPVIKAVKNHIDKTKTVIIDAPPGTTCPTIEAIKGSNFCLLVTEPTPFGLNDLILSVATLKKINIPYGVIINRSNLGDNSTEQYCNQEDIPILMRIKFDKKIAAAYSNGTPLINIYPEYRQHFGDLLKKIKTIVETP
ncbi:MAG: ATP-binding protein [Gammaproteobacteria bacterium]|nr:ATP-binding protein [Gammaproteobacteria bacterium]